MTPEKLKKLTFSIFDTYEQVIRPQQLLEAINNNIELVNNKKFNPNSFLKEYNNIRYDYNIVKLYTEAAIKEEDMRTAKRLAEKWNAALKTRISDFNLAFSKYGYTEQGGIKKDYTITPEKIKYMYKKSMKPVVDPLQEKLQ